MTEHNITLAVGATKVLHTAGQYCDRDIVVTAEKGDGYDNGYNEGVEAGKKAEYDRFWDSYQQKGNRTNYESGFAGIGWNDETFTPKYNVFSNTDYMLFRGSEITDLGAAIRNSGKRFVMNVNRLEYTFSLCRILENVEGIEFAAPLHRITNAFANCSMLKKIQTLPISENADTLDFRNIPLLEDISFSGVIPVNISFAQSENLATASVQSIIDHLKDLTGATAQTLTFHATVGAKLTAEQKAAITAKNWTLVY